MEQRVPARRVLGLAVPALGVLAAEPLYLLVDTAVVGRLGAVALAALAVGGVVLVQVSTQLTFLSYGTTARTARLYGAGRRADAVAEGAQATWLALGIGAVLLVAGQLVAGPVTRLLAGPGEVADAAVGWLRIALLGAPFVLVTLVGNGWMRGVRTSAAVAGAHQVVYQLWAFLALVLDSLAIAAQSLVGAALGSDQPAAARSLAWQVTRYGLALGIALGLIFAAVEPVLPGVFTTDAEVLAEIPHAWWFFVALQPVAGVVFALDGVLLGAGDAAFLRTATLGSALVGFLPMVWASLAFGWGLTGIWSGLAAFMLLRLGAVVARTRGGAWAVSGAAR